MNNNKQWLPVWAAPIVLVMAVGTVWLRLQIVGTTYSINETNRMIRNAKQEREQIELKLAGQRSPRKLEAMAKARFGLNQPATNQVVYFK